MLRTRFHTRAATRLVCSVIMTLSAAALASQVPAAAVEPVPIQDPVAASLVVDHASVPAPLAAQLTDPVTATFSASSGMGADALSASATGLPTGVVLSAKVPTSPTAASWSISGTPTGVPGTYPAHVTVSDTATSDGFDVSVVVAAEDATAVYTGPTSVVGPDWAADSVPVTMTAQVTQAPDGHLGAIEAATVDFTNTLLDEDLCAGVPVAASGVATCTFAADLSEYDFVQYTIGLTVSGAYVGESAAETTLTVSLPDEPAPVPPETTITAGPSGWLLDASAIFGFASSAPNSDFFCKLDGAKQACAGPSVTLSELSQRTHRFTVLAEDEDGERDETPATRDFAVPLDDTGLKGSTTWKRVHNAASYLGTYSQARKKGLALSYKVADVRELALLVRTGKKFGAVKVYLDGTLLATVKTAGQARQRMVNLAHFSQARSGTVKIVTTTGRTVRIDGLGTSTVAF